MPKTKRPPKRPVAPKKVQQEHCCICMSDIEDKRRASIDSCDHKFCKSCIETWAEKENSCPLCRKSFTTIQYRLGGKEKVCAVEERVQGEGTRPYSNGDFLSHWMNEWEHMANLARLHDLAVGRFYLVIVMKVLRFVQDSSRCDLFFRTNFGMIQLWDLPHDYLYHRQVRLLTLIMFARDGVFRDHLCFALAHDARYERRRIVSAQMMFNVINRFFTLSKVNVQQSDGQSSPLIEQFKRCHRMVFPHANGMQGHLVDVDELPRRMEHPPLQRSVCRSNHPQLMRFYNLIKHGEPDYARLDEFPVIMVEF